MNETINNETLVTNDAKREKNGLATAALVLGILSLVTMLLLINYILGIVSLVLAIVYLKKKKTSLQSAKQSPVWYVRLYQ